VRATWMVDRNARSAASRARLENEHELPGASRPPTSLLYKGETLLIGRGDPHLCRKTQYLTAIAIAT